MKRIISVLLVLITVICLFSGCTIKKASDVRLGLAAPTVTHGWVAGVSYYAEKHCSENGIEYNITTSSNAAEMEKKINELTEWGADALVVWPQWPGMENAVKSVIDKGIPVVGFDVDIECDGVYKVTGNNYDMGYQCAKYITEKVGDSAVIAVMDVPSVGSVSQLRKQGFYDYLKETDYDISNIFEVSEKGFTREAGYSDMKMILEQYSRVDAVFSMDDETSIGVVQAITESGRKDIKAVTGGGGMQEYFRMISDEKYSEMGLSSALYSPSMIEDAIDTAIELCKGKSSSRVIVIPTTVVTAENVNDFLDSKNTVY